MSEVNVANHVLEFILKDQSFLKVNNFLPHQAYRDVVAMLLNHISNQSNTADTSKSHLLTRKSTSSTINSIIPPVAQPREMPSFPKLPVRRTPSWQSTQLQQQHHHHQAPQQLVGMVMPSVTKNILHSELEKSTPPPPPPPPPPAYTQKPTKESPSLATAKALYDYKGEDSSTDLSFRQGDSVEVTEYGMFAHIRSDIFHKLPNALKHIQGIRRFRMRGTSWKTFKFTKSRNISKFEAVLGSHLTEALQN